MEQQHEERLSVLVVEDDVLVRLSIADDLRQAGFTVLEAAHADEASTVLAVHADGIGVVLTDIQMPGAVDGRGLIALIRKQYPRLRVVALSGASAEVLATVEADALLTKPHHPQQLIQIIHRLLEGRADNGSRNSNAGSN
jgi:CheY-like chemotaxis protein